MLRARDDIIQAKLGYVADPGIDMLLDKELIAKIRIREIEMQIKLLEMQLDTARLAADALREQYEIG